MTLTATTRARIILDLLKDGVVATEAAYGASIDKAPLAVLGRFATTFQAAYPFTVFDAGTPPLPRTPTNEELANNLLKQLKLFMRGTHVQQRLATDIPVQTKISSDAATAETAEDIGE